MNAAPPRTADVAVLGAGPAGVAAAVGLARMGWSVRLFTGAGRIGIEGASDRVLDLLRKRHLPSALASIGVRGPRMRDWAGTAFANGEEYLVDRAGFDAALRADALTAGVQCESWARDVSRDGAGWQVRTAGSQLRARALVDARGRRRRGPAQRGPRLLALTQRYRGAGPAGTAVMMAEQAWHWLACDGVGGIQVQAVGSPRGSGDAARLRQRLLGAASWPRLLAERLAGATPEGGVRACAAGAACRAPAEVEGRVLAGDATLALDPLSGHGLYEALATTPAVVAAINTWLSGGAWSPVRKFLTARTQESWMRKIEAAGGFYADAAAHGGDGFWSETARAYARTAASDVQRDDAKLRIETRPVLNGARIEERRVLVGGAWPRGIWCHGDVELAELLESGEQLGWDATRTAAKLGRTPQAVHNAMHWLKINGAWPVGDAQQRVYVTAGDDVRE